MVREQHCATVSVKEEGIGCFDWRMATTVSELCLVKHFDA